VATGAAPHTAVDLKLWRITAGTHTARLRCVIREFGRVGEFALDAGVTVPGNWPVIRLA
jgi:hypothetical protein